MNIEVGQWYRCREEHIIAHVVGEIIGDESYRYIAAVYSHGEYSMVGSYSREGSYIPDFKSRLDLVEYLPDCTGPNWKPQKWRKAKIGDAENPLECRVVESITGQVLHKGKLAGVRFQRGRFCEFYVDLPLRFQWFECTDVEVLDD